MLIVNFVERDLIDSISFWNLVSNWDSKLCDKSRIFKFIMCEIWMLITYSKFLAKLIFVRQILFPNIKSGSVVISFVDKSSFLKSLKYLNTWSPFLANSLPNRFSDKDRLTTFKPFFIELLNDPVNEIMLFWEKSASNGMLLSFRMSVIVRKTLTELSRKFKYFKFVWERKCDCYWFRCIVPDPWHVKCFQLWRQFVPHEFAVMVWRSCLVTYIQFY